MHQRQKILIHQKFYPENNIQIGSPSFQAHFLDLEKCWDSNIAISPNLTFSFPAKIVFSLSSQKITSLFPGFCITMQSMKINLM